MARPLEYGTQRLAEARGSLSRRPTCGDGASPGIAHTLIHKQVRKANGYRYRRPNRSRDREGAVRENRSLTVAALMKLEYSRKCERRFISNCELRSQSGGVAAALQISKLTCV